MTGIGSAFVLSIASLGLSAADAPADGSPEGRALAYLSREVPLWSVEHKCFSCHNNGDAARALYAAVRLGRSIGREATADTDRWLGKPESWEKNGGEGAFVDKALARLQFASALASAIEAGRVEDRTALAKAASRMADDQAEDGSWAVDDRGRVGSPATYGRMVATWRGRDVLRAADPARFRDRIDRADRWLKGQPIRSVLDASTVLLARAFDDSRAGRSRFREALDLLERGRSGDGGWGPTVSSPPEAFDTALALLALDPWRDRPGVPEMIAKGRAYLVSIQQEDGSWVETTRPAGSESYAQRLSTTGWATLALLNVSGVESPARPQPARR